ncbi:MAG TPA: SDR family NAD(P)-dependent oxidoreductase [Balneolaceae bacterium]|nr:SDR family NAD(P)-dependent oxidoreductase [Balneolaceae bacterium]
MNLESKIAIVTGASSGMGEHFSRALAEKGAIVYGLARTTEKLEKIRRQLGERFIPVTMDITRPEAIEEWIDQTFGSDHLPDILINNAGLARFSDVDELSLKDWNVMMNTNLSGTFYMCRNIVPLMKQNEAVCHIVNIASIAGKVGRPTMSGYNASKFGVRGFSEALFQELRYDGIKVSCFNPGSTATDFFDEPHANMMQPEDVAGALINVLETPDNFLINDITMRPLNPKRPEEE